MTNPPTPRTGTPVQAIPPGSRTGQLQLHLPAGWPLRWTERPALFRWRLTVGDQVSSGESALSEIPRARELIVVLAAEHVLCVPVGLPIGRAGRTAQVLRNAVEDALITPTDGAHVVAMEALGNGKTLVAVIDQTLLQAAVDELIACDLRPSRIASEAECFSGVAPRTWQVVLGADGGFVHVAGLETVALDQTVPDRPDVVPLGLQSLIAERAAQAEGPASISVHSSTPGRVNVAAWSTQLGVPVNDAGPWAPQTRHLALRGLDLGVRGTRARRGPSAWAAYRPAGWILALALCIQLGFTAIENWQMHREQRQLRQSMENRFRRVFPDARTIADPVVQMNRLYEAQVHGKAGTAPGDFLNLFARVGGALASLHARTDAARYEHAQLSLDLTLPAGQSIDRLQAQLPAGARVVIEHVAPVDATGAIATTIRIVAEGS